MKKKGRTKKPRVATKAILDKFRNTVQKVRQNRRHRIEKRLRNQGTKQAIMVIPASPLNNTETIIIETDESDQSSDVTNKRKIYKPATDDHNTEISIDPSVNSLDTSPATNASTIPDTTREYCSFHECDVLLPVDGDLDNNTIHREETHMETVKSDRMLIETDQLFIKYDQSNESTLDSPDETREYSTDQDYEAVLPVLHDLDDNTDHRENIPIEIDQLSIQTDQSDESIRMYLDISTSKSPVINVSKSLETEYFTGDDYDVLLPVAPDDNIYHREDINIATDHISIRTASMETEQSGKCIRRSPEISTSKSPDETRQYSAENDYGVVLPGPSDRDDNTDQGKEQSMKTDQMIIETDKLSMDADEISTETEQLSIKTDQIPLETDELPIETYQKDKSVSTAVAETSTSKYPDESRDYSGDKDNDTVLPDATEKLYHNEEMNIDTDFTDHDYEVVLPVLPYFEGKTDHREKLATETDELTIETDKSDESISPEVSIIKRENSTDHDHDTVLPDASNRTDHIKEINVGTGRTELYDKHKSETIDSPDFGFSIHKHILGNVDLKTKECDDDDEEEVSNQEANTNFGETNTTFKFGIEAAVWETIKPEIRLYGRGRGERTTRRLKNNWTDKFAEGANAVHPGCVLTFKRHTVKAQGSRKINAPFVTAVATCTGKACTTSFMFVIQHEPPLDVSVNVKCEVTGIPTHLADEVNRRNITRTDRENMAEQIKYVGCAQTYYHNVLKGEKEQMSKGNYTTVPNSTVLRKLVSEFVKKETLHNNMFAELQLLKESYDSENDNYIHEIGFNPFYLILYCRKQINLMKTLSMHGDLKIYIDATGAIINNIPEQKRPFLYSVVIKPNEHLPPISLADMVSTSHTIPRIKLFLETVKRAVALTGHHLRVQKIETDYSYPLMQACLETFNHMDVKRYLTKCLAVAKNKKILDCFYVHHLCSAHILRDFMRQLKKEIRSLPKATRMFIYKSFVAMQNVTTLDEALRVYTYVCYIFQSEVKCPQLLESMKNMKTQFCKFEEEDIEEDTEIDEEVEEAIEDTTMDNTTIKKSSPFTAMFGDVRANVVGDLQESNRGEQYDNNYLYCPEVVDCLSDKFMHLIPMWSGILLSILPAEEGHILTRDTNSWVENWFRFVKCDVFKKREQPSRFVIGLKNAVQARLLEHEFQGCRKRKSKQINKQSETGLSIVTKEEMWQKRKKMTRFHTTPKTRKVVTRQNVPASKNQVGPLTKAVTTPVKSTDKKNASTSEKESAPACLKTTAKQEVLAYGKEAATVTKTNLYPEKRTEKLKSSTSENPTTLVNMITPATVKSAVVASIKRPNLPTVAKWGGNLEGAAFYNTCTIDNFLTILHLRYTESESLRQLFSKDKGGMFTSLVKVFELMSQKKFAAAKLTWLNHINIPVTPSTNLFGDEVDYFVKHIEKQWETTTTSKCSSQSCPHAYEAPNQGHGIRFSSSVPTVSVQVGIERWFRNDDECTHEITGAVDVNSQDESTYENGNMCRGTRHTESKLLTQSPVLSLRVYEQCLHDRITLKTIMAGKMVMVSGKKYVMAGVTLYRGKHYCAIVIPKESEPMWYDGLVGRLTRLPGDIGSWLPSHIIYCQT